MTMYMSGHGYKLEVVFPFLRAQELELARLWSQAPIGTQMSVSTTGFVVQTFFLIHHDHSHVHSTYLFISSGVSRPEQ
jgi:hypothetical protein